jgi:hypothetical protein
MISRDHTGLCNTPCSISFDCSLIRRANKLKLFASQLCLDILCFERLQTKGETADSRDSESMGIQGIRNPPFPPWFFLLYFVSSDVINGHFYAYIFATLS